LKLPNTKIETYIYSDVTRPFTIQDRRQIIPPATLDLHFGI